MSRAESDAELWFEGPAFHMFVVLLLVYVVGAVEWAPAVGSRLVNLLTIGAVFFGLRSVTRQTRVIWVGIGLTLGYVLLSEVARLLGSTLDYRWDTAFVLVVFAFMLGVMAKVVMRREKVTADKIFAAACVYMLMGIFFGLLFALIELNAPASFALSEADREAVTASLIHYSFTTLTTVGYGDISPMSALARSLSDIEAVIAQLYLAVVLARLVSLQITRGSSFDRAD